MNHMPPHMRQIPKAGDGEDLTRLIERAGAYSSMSPLVTRKKVMRRDYDPIDGMPTGIQDIFDTFGPVWGTLEELITDHTLWGLYCNGIPEYRHQEQWNRLRYRQLGPVHMSRAPLLHGMGARVNRQCTVCEELALKEGDAYYHRRLAVPYASVCPIHKEPLRLIHEQHRLFDQQCLSEATSYQFERAWQLSVRMEYCIETPPSLSKYRKDAVIETLKRTGWIGANGRLNAQLFVDKFISHNDGAFSDARLALLCQSEEHIRNALAALRRPDHAVFPTWCVLFTEFSEMHQCPVTRASITENKRIADPAIAAERTSGELALALEKHRSIKATAVALDMSREELTGLCRRYEIPIAWRAKRIDRTLRTAIYEALRKGMPPEDVISFFGISLTTLYREMKAWPDLLLPGKQKQLEHIKRCREEWEVLLVANPGLNETQLRRINTAAWTVLYRHASSGFYRSDRRRIHLRLRRKAIPWSWWPSSMVPYRMLVTYLVQIAASPYARAYTASGLKLD
ncbi:hypothetical protein EJD96_21970 [Herbaspirillum seropedicae]|uniref:hypothetical protein n=1 Tax=Herbaspirillum seropedicae TaxID=964 RepID=UPI00111ECA95|nr:hypothetical protein [Herbaspirillum seropedicae]QDD66641.1 hypothetical protein EJD96_21970 [Herbaspirillum seropedicae]